MCGGLCAERPESWPVLKEGLLRGNGDSNGYLLHIMVSRLPMANSEFQDLGESIRVRAGWVLAEPAMGKWFENLDEEDVRSASIAAAMMLGFVCLVIVWYLEFRPPGYSD
jgi:hypothetical protein